MRVVNIHVEIVFEMLNCFKSDLDSLKSSNFWPCECLVQNSECVYSWWLYSEFTCNQHCVFVVFNIEFSWELVHFPFHLFNMNPESFFTLSFWSSSGINDSAISLSKDLQCIDIFLGIRGIRWLWVWAVSNLLFLNWFYLG